MVGRGCSDWHETPLVPRIKPLPVHQAQSARGQCWPSTIDPKVALLIRHLFFCRQFLPVCFVYFLQKFSTRPERKLVRTTLSILLPGLSSCRSRCQRKPVFARIVHELEPPLQLVLSVKARLRRLYSFHLACTLTSSSIFCMMWSMIPSNNSRRPEHLNCIFNSQLFPIGLIQVFM